MSKRFDIWRSRYANLMGDMLYGAIRSGFLAINGYGELWVEIEQCPRGHAWRVEQRAGMTLEWNGQHSVYATRHGPTRIIASGEVTDQPRTEQRACRAAAEAFAVALANQDRREAADVQRQRRA